MKKGSILLLVIAVILSFRTAAQNHATTIRVQAMDMGNAVIRNDFNSFSKYMHPAVFSFAGGKEQMKSKMDSASQFMQRFGVTFKRYWIGSPGKIIKYKNQLQTLLPQSTTMQTPMGELTAESWWIVISNDKGKTWWFIDTNMYQANKLKDQLPELSPQLVIPARKEPRLVPNQ